MGNRQNDEKRERVKAQQQVTDERWREGRKKKTCDSSMLNDLKGLIRGGEKLNIDLENEDQKACRCGPCDGPINKLQSLGDRPGK